jgi:hypothetical protein
MGSTLWGDMLHNQLHIDTKWDRPLSVLQQFLVALNHYTGCHFHRTSALCGGISHPTVYHVSLRVLNTIFEHKARFLKMLTEEQKQVTAAT